jgi:hypothetical protein
MIDTVAMREPGLLEGDHIRRSQPVGAVDDEGATAGSVTDRSPCET